MTDFFANTLSPSTMQTTTATATVYRRALFDINGSSNSSSSSNGANVDSGGDCDDSRGGSSKKRRRTIDNESTRDATADIVMVTRRRDDESASSTAATAANVSPSSSTSTIAEDTLQVLFPPSPSMSSPSSSPLTTPTNKTIDYRMLADSVGLPGARLDMKLVRLLPYRLLFAFFGNLKQRGSCIVHDSARKIKINGTRVSYTKLALRLFGAENSQFVSAVLSPSSSASSSSSSASSSPLSQLLPSMTHAVRYWCTANGTDDSSSSSNNVHRGEHHRQGRCIHPDHAYAVVTDDVIVSASETTASLFLEERRRRWIQRSRQHVKRLRTSRQQRRTASFARLGRTDEQPTKDDDDDDDDDAADVDDVSSASSTIPEPLPTSTISEKRSRRKTSMLENIANMWIRYHDLCRRMETEPLSASSASSMSSASASSSAIVVISNIRKSRDAADDASIDGDGDDGEDISSWLVPANVDVTMQWDGMPDRTVASFAETSHFIDKTT